MTDTAFPAWIAGGVFGIIHLIFSGIHRISGGGGGGHGEESHGG